MLVFPSPPPVCIVTPLLTYLRFGEPASKYNPDYHRQYDQGDDDGHDDPDVGGTESAFLGFYCGETVCVRGVQRRGGEGKGVWGWRRVSENTKP